MRETFSHFLLYYFSATIGFFLFINCFYVVILFLGYLNARKHHYEKVLNISKRLSPLKGLMQISILVPCYNEERTVVDSLNSMLRLDYPNYEVIVCNDGSKDRTIDILITEFGLCKIDAKPPMTLPCNEILAVYRSSRYANLTVIDKRNGGKADALNAAINFSQYPLICCVDSDSIIDNEGLITVSMPFLEDDHVIATGGTILLANSRSGDSGNKLTDVNTEVASTWLGVIQGVEYLRAFLVGRLGWDYLGCDFIISGAFGLFKKSIVVRAGGYATKTIGEDMELLLRMQACCLASNEKFSVKALSIPVCWTEPPSDLKTLGNQRIRWTQGLIECLRIHRKMLFRPWAGSLGMVALPFLLMFELISAPVEIIGLLVSVVGLLLGIFSWEMVGAFFSVTIIFGCILNLGAIIIDQLTVERYSKVSDILKLILGSILEHLGFRQLHLYWRMCGIYRSVRGKQMWGDMKRVGLSRPKK